MLNLTVGYNQAKAAITRVLVAGLVPYITSSPGLGKSSLIKAVANEFNLQLIDIRLSMFEPSEINGLPNFTNTGEAYFAPFNLFPLETTPLPKDKSGWLILCDELSSASKQTIAAAYKLILDKQVGNYNLHPNTAIVCAGNRMQDRALVNTLSTAMQSRLVHLELEVNFTEWLEIIGIPHKYDNRILAYLAQYPSKLNSFKPDHQDKTYACPRSWEFLNKLIKDTEITKDDIPLFAGTVSEVIAVEFVQFTEIFNDIPKIQDILTNPNNTSVPDNTSARWSILTVMLDHISDDSIEAVLRYSEQFPLDLRIYFLRSLLVKHPSFKLHQALTQTLVSMSRYINS